MRPSRLSFSTVSLALVLTFVYAASTTLSAPQTVDPASAGAAAASAAAPVAVPTAAPAAGQPAIVLTKR